MAREFRIPAVLGTGRATNTFSDSQLLEVDGDAGIVCVIIEVEDSERSLEYRRKQGLSVERLHLAVLVQQLVASDVSAVVFSANPITDNLDEILINASWGLGESIVGGTVTPDTFVVRKTDLAITGRIIVNKQCMTVAVSGAPTRALCRASCATRPP